jgi:hypothetical protein
MSGEGKEVIIWAVLLKDIGLLVLGAIIGLGVSEYTAWRRRSEDKKKEAVNIVAEIVKYLLKINTMANDIKERMAHFREREGDPQVAREHREYMIKTKEKLPELEVEELFREFQLDLVGNQDIRKKFRPLIDAYGNYVASFDKDIKTFEEKESVYRELYKEFMDFCLVTCKANAPIRTLSAPAKKKLARVKIGDVEALK